MQKLTSYQGITHWAAFQIAPSGWRRTAVYRLEAQSDDGTIFYFRLLGTQKQFAQPVTLLRSSSFRPFAYEGGRR